MVGQNTQPQAPQSVPVHSQGNLVAPPQPVVTSGVQSAGVPLNPPIGLGQNMPVSQQQPIQVLGFYYFETVQSRSETLKSNIKFRWHIQPRAKPSQCQYLHKQLLLSLRNHSNQSRLPNNNQTNPNYNLRSHNKTNRWFNRKTNHPSSRLRNRSRSRP